MVERGRARPANTELPLLKLYIGGQSARSAAALRAVRHACDHQSQAFRLEVIDVHDSPQALRSDSVMALPTLVAGTARLVGEFDSDHVLDLLRDA